jgi:hypothetical protein
MRARCRLGSPVSDGAGPPGHRTAATYDNAARPLFRTPTKCRTPLRSVKALTVRPAHLAGAARWVQADYLMPVRKSGKTR